MGTKRTRRRTLPNRTRSIRRAYPQTFGEMRKKNANDVAAQASFFLGMGLPRLGTIPGYAVDAYSQSHVLDPYHWAAVANLAAVHHIGLCILHDLEAMCALEDDPEMPVSCMELAPHAFAQAIEWGPDNESAKHMLATIKEDATMKRVDYVKLLFIDYAVNFEHSLVQELGYTGYERLRRAFDRAFDQKSPTFDMVVDAGCGTRTGKLCNHSDRL